MRDDHEGNVIDIPRPKSGNIRDIIKAANQPVPVPEPEAAEEIPAGPPSTRLTDDVILPNPSDPYVAYARQSRHEETLHVMGRDGCWRGFPWARYDGIDTVLPAGNPGGGPVLVLRFDCLQAMEVRITGTKLKELHVYLSQRRMPWIRMKPPGVILSPAQKAAPVITDIVIEPWKPQPV